MRPGAIEFGHGFNLPNSDEIGVALERHRRRLEQESTPESARLPERRRDTSPKIHRIGDEL
jgi:hypothetical protein